MEMNKDVDIAFLLDFTEISCVIRLAHGEKLYIKLSYFVFMFKANKDKQMFKTAIP